MSYYKFVVLILFLILVNKTPAQYKSALNQGNADYPVPNPVALQAINDEVPSLLCPSTVRDMSIALNFANSAHQKSVTAGIEIAPFLAGNFIDMSEYLSGRLIRVLLRTRISIASMLDQQGDPRIALGFRWMLHDDADLRADSSFQRRLMLLAQNSPGIESNCAEKYQAGSAAFKNCLSEKVSSQLYTQTRIDSLRNLMKDSLWNKSVFEIAFAMLYKSSADDLNMQSRKLRIERYHFYVNGAIPMLKSSGQIIFGAGGWLGYDSYTPGYQRKGALIVRSVYGSIYERAFIDAKLVSTNKYKPDYIIGIGAMFNLANGLWIQSGFGESLLKRSWSGTDVNLNLIFGTPEL